MLQMRGTGENRGKSMFNEIETTVPSNGKLYHYALLDEKGTSHELFNIIYYVYRACEIARSVAKTG